jgi:hypothetical protein
MNGGRKCEGYSHPQTSSASRNVVTIYVPPVQKQLVPFPSSTESKFYHQVIAGKLSGCFDSDFWSTLVLQLSQSEPAIRHAVRAISAVYRDMEVAAPVMLLNRDIPASPLALQESTMAMRCLLKDIKADQSSSLVPLVACLLFTCLEFLSGTVDSAMVHILSGLKILNASRQSSSLGNSQRHIGGIDGMVVDEHVIPMFSRLEVLCVLFGHNVPSGHYTSQNQKRMTGFTCLTDARMRLFEVMGLILRFIREIPTDRIWDPDSQTDRFMVRPEDYVQRLTLQRELQQWYSDLNELASSLMGSNQPLNEHAINIMRIHHRVIFLWLSVSVSIEESVHDLHTRDYEEILSLATKLTSNVSPESTQPRPENFSFEMQIIAPLYYTAIKCRIPSLRRRALHLLDFAPRREGLWNAHIATKIAERIIEIEERDLPSRQGIHFDSCHIDDGSVPTEIARIHGVGELPGEFGQFQDIMMAGVACPDHIKVTFRSKPWGVAGEWHEFQEHILL